MPYSILLSKYDFDVKVECLAISTRTCSNLKQASYRAGRYFCYRLHRQNTVAEIISCDGSRKLLPRKGYDANPVTCSNDNEDRKYVNMEHLTKIDLENLRVQILLDLRTLLADKSLLINKPWLRGKEVKRLLGISEGSLQHLRVTGQLSASRIGGIYYYRYADIEKMMGEGDKQKPNK
jgi:hypothetical protein